MFTENKNSFEGKHSVWISKAIDIKIVFSWQVVAALRDSRQPPIFGLSISCKLTRRRLFSFYSSISWTC